MKPTLFALLILTSCRLTAAADWITAPSYYTHDPQTGKRTSQYAAIGPYYYLHREDFIRSGYRHIRSSLQVGGSADNMHIVEEYGNPVRPYDEWRFPYRPYSVPYPLWGNPNAGAGWGFGAGIGGPGWGPGGGANLNYPPALIPPGHGYVPQPWMDGHYPSYDRHDRSQYHQPYGPPGP